MFYLFFNFTLVTKTELQNFNSELWLFLCEIISQNCEKIKHILQDKTQNCKEKSQNSESEFWGGKKAQFQGFLFSGGNQLPVLLQHCVLLSFCLSALLFSSGITEWCNSPCTLFLQFTHSTALHLEFGQIRRFGSTEEETHTDACFYCV